MTTNLTEIKQRIKQLRTEKNISRAEFSRISEIPLRMLEDIENINKNVDPRLSTLLKIVSALNITLNDLYL